MRSQRKLFERRFFLVLMFSASAAFAKDDGWVMDAYTASAADVVFLFRGTLKEERAGKRIDFEYDPTTQFGPPKGVAAGCGVAIFQHQVHLFNEASPVLFLPLINMQWPEITKALKIAASKTERFVAFKQTQSLPNSEIDIDPGPMTRMTVSYRFPHEPSGMRFSMDDTENVFILEFRDDQIQRYEERRYPAPYAIPQVYRPFMHKNKIELKTDETGRPYFPLYSCEPPLVS